MGDISQAFQLFPGGSQNAVVNKVFKSMRPYPDQTETFLSQKYQYEGYLKFSNPVDFEQVDQTVLKNSSQMLQRTGSENI